MLYNSDKLLYTLYEMINNSYSMMCREGSSSSINDLIILDAAESCINTLINNRLQRQQTMPWTRVYAS